MDQMELSELPSKTSCRRVTLSSVGLGTKLIFLGSVILSWPTDVHECWRHMQNSGGKMTSSWCRRRILSIWSMMRLLIRQEMSVSLPHWKFQKRSVQTCHSNQRRRCRPITMSLIRINGGRPICWRRWTSQRKGHSKRCSWTKMIRKFTLWYRGLAT